MIQSIVTFTESYFWFIIGILWFGFLVLSYTEIKDIAEKTFKVTIEDE